MTSSNREAVFNFFVEKGILLRDEWLQACLEFLYGRSVLRNQQIARINALVFQQWLNTDLADSSYPSIEQIGLNLNERRIKLPSQLILQITSISNIGMSAHSQLNGLTHEVIDDSGFEPLPEKDSENFVNEVAKRCLLFEANDGSRNVKLLEYFPIPFFSLKTRPGAKVLILPNTLLREGTFYLTPKNCQLLGGEVEKFASGLPIDVLRKRLNLSSLQPASSTGKENAPQNGRGIPSSSVSISSQKPSTISISKIDEKVAVNSTKATTLKDNSTPSTSHQAYTILDEDDFQDDTDYKPDEKNQVSFMDSKNFDIEEEDSFDAPTASELRRLREHQLARKYGAPINKSIPETRDQSPSLPDFSMSEELPPTPPPKQPQPGINRPSIQAQNLFSAPPVKRSRPSMLTTIKKEPEDVEVIDLDDDMDWKPPPKTLHGALEQYEKIEREEKEVGSRKETEIKRRLEKTQENSGEMDHWNKASTNITIQEEPPVLVAFKALKIIYIADALKQMRYTIGSLKRNVQAVIERIVEPLKIVDGSWTQTVAIRDESTPAEGINCIVSGKVLNSLIGMSPDEAAEVRRSSNLQRRSEGKARILALQHAMERLDLVLEIEFFARREVTPVICDLETLTQKLNML